MTESIAEYLQRVITPQICDSEIAGKFIQRVKEDKPTRDENKETHFCVYFAAFDPKLGEIFLGQHIKSGLWLFNGGHIDKGESPVQALGREIGEEWGIPIDPETLDNPALLTITPVNNPTKQPCKFHYDIWYLVKLNKREFTPNQTKLDKEFYQTKWFNPAEARLLVKDPSTLQAIEVIEARFS